MGMEIDGFASTGLFVCSCLIEACWFIELGCLCRWYVFYWLTLLLLLPLLLLLLFCTMLYLISYKKMRWNCSDIVEVVGRR